LEPLFTLGAGHFGVCWFWLARSVMRQYRARATVPGSLATPGR